MSASIAVREPKYSREQILAMPIIPGGVWWREFGVFDLLCVWDDQGIAWEPVETYTGPMRKKYFG